jgi:prevent-host-death family protein
MRTVGIAQLKTHLSRYLGHVEKGEEVLVTDRGMPVARIVPLRKGEQEESRRQRLAKAGVLQLGSGRGRYRLLRPPKGVRGGYGVLEALLDERREGR